MFKAVKYFMISFVFFLSSAVSCSEKKEVDFEEEEVHKKWDREKKEEVDVPRTECEQIKDVVTDCLGLHRGALGYISSCGDISLVEIKALNSCEEIFNHIENKD